MPMPSTMDATTANIRAELARANKTQSDLAAKLGISQAQVSKRLQGRIPWRLDELVATSDLLGVPLSTLLVAA